MAVFSKFKTLNISCKEYVHPWNDSCLSAHVGVLYDAIPEAFRIYLTAYTLALLIRGRIPKKRDLQKTLYGVVQSTLFLSTHAIGYSMVLCILRRILGNFNFLTVSFLPSFLSSIIAILLERPSRRGVLSLYVTNVASETLFQMAVWRKWVKAVPYAEVGIFAISVSVLLYFYKSKHFADDPIYSLLRFIVGPYEESGFIPPSEYIRHDVLSLKYYSGDSILLKNYVKLQNWFKTLLFKIKTTPSHISCPHPNSCLYYSLQGGAKMFSVGYLLQLSLQLLLQIKKIFKKPSHLHKIIFQKQTMKLGAFFAAFSILFRSICCYMRNTQGFDSKHFACPAGIIAGLSFLFFRENTIAMYVMWKSFHVIYNRGVEKGFLKEVPYANVILHSFSTAVLFHAAIFEPQNLRPSYWRFLIGMSGGRIVRMDRKCIDKFGLNSSKSLMDVLAKQNKTLTDFPICQ